MELGAFGCQNRLKLFQKLFLGVFWMATYNLLRVEDMIYIHFGTDEQDPEYQLAYDGLPNRIEIGEAELIGTVDLSQEQLEKIRAEYENGGECGWCDNVVSELRDCHQFDRSEDGEKMCHECWNHDRAMYLKSYGEDIGPFKEGDDSKKCIQCKNYIMKDKQLSLDGCDDPDFIGKIICEDCAQVMSDLAP
jgi:hypothetical protein